MTADRRAGHARGLVAEGLAAWMLRFKGYRVLATRYRTSLGEIDIVARRGHVLAFVEVKARPTLEAGLEAIAAEGYRRIEAAADLYLARHPQFSDFTLRFDLVVVRPRRWPYHIENAFS
ncbi:YraN family protein [Pleomorphomonas oryzae]|uniref:YraN family protein n=1 Tax=Pleomorphomonas oryzae TaxID=261934 RepID=UPI0003FE658C|nr:YraN family protein [Pleomorphomonas oryzae]